MTSIYLIWSHRFFCTQQWLICITWMFQASFLLFNTRLFMFRCRLYRQVREQCRPGQSAILVFLLIHIKNWTWVKWESRDANKLWIREWARAPPGQQPPTTLAAVCYPGTFFYSYTLLYRGEEVKPQSYRYKGCDTW